jgi:hypothetical protein
MNFPNHDIVVDLMAELDGLGIQLEIDGEHLRFRPRDKITMDLADRMKRHKVELLAMLAHSAKLDQRIVDQLARLVPCRMANGRRGWVNPKYRAELDRLGPL